MRTVIDALASISAYPVPLATLEDAAGENGLDGAVEATEDVRRSAAFKRAKARIYRFLAEAPNVSQGGISYSFTATEKDMFRKQANDLLADADGDDDGGCYGWMGEDF